MVLSKASLSASLYLLHACLISPQIVIVKSQDTCLLTNNADGLPPFLGYTGNAGRPERRIQHQNQAIIPSYRFNCCGNITEWGVDLNPAEVNVTFDFELQVWRPSPTTTETGCYSLVNNFIVRSTALPLSPESEHVARVTPSPQDQLQFQPGDVLGFYVESQGTDSNRDNGVVLLNTANFTSELVWHASITDRASLSGSCPYPVGTSGVLNSSTRAAPVISLSIATHSICSISITRVNSAQPQPSVSSTRTSGDDLHQNVNPGAFISTTTFAGIAVPLVLLFGAVNVVTILCIVLLYCKIRKLHTAVLSKSENAPYSQVRYVPRKESLPPGEDHYDSPDMYSAHLIQAKKNVAYRSTMNRETNN